MSTVFTKIIQGELPGRFVYEDERCVAFLSIQPLSEGHVLVVPREEVDHWIDLPEELAEHLMDVARRIGRAIRTAYSPRRVGLMIQGFEVPHTHLHVWPTDSIEEFDFANVDQDPAEESMDRAQVRIRRALAEQD
ncbi:MULTISPECIES: HIT family protein [Rothia]|uniref:Diadenosine tetraphosphate hydrolase n=1 Tax=Rothia kristinae TaxID=37923 RepID=A0A199PIR6_9MICC|nr:HIT family protein [Rothia kristinae]SIL80858.1 histidine triad (HIT) protein [Mycobacteroides abscessus subsp. abscessus]MCT1357704.1 HIT family protein [Rothia kristinae]MCT1393771.1 HIT family protein [Rothia kristinae]MCT1505520.1 HIT family protein [Rothia kristinae]MCT2038930.1 HIT family protein [Rothia kristinae]